jgi:hypothetical protein
MTLRQMAKQPSAFLPVAMSLAAIATLVIAIGVAGGIDRVQREPDEGTAAHLWQLLMAAQFPIIVYFGIKWLPRSPRFALIVLGVQFLAAVAAMAPVFLLGL